MREQRRDTAASTSAGRREEAEEGEGGGDSPGSESPWSRHEAGSLIRTSPALAPETQRRASPLEAPSAKTATRSRGAKPPRASTQDARSSAVEEGEEAEEEEGEAEAEVEEVEEKTGRRWLDDDDGDSNLRSRIVTAARGG
jgi:hypothetical protein